MNKKLISFLVALLMLVSVFTPQLNVSAADSGIRVQFGNGNTPTSSNTISAKFKVVNTGSSAINLAELKLRYYYTADADKPQSFWCDFAGMMSELKYVVATEKVTGTIVRMSAPAVDADTYLEVGFKNDAGSLAAGGTIEIQTRVTRNDWSNYDQSNDYSYKASDSYVDWNKITAYQGGNLVFGLQSVGPEFPQGPFISQTNYRVPQGLATDLYITLTPNGYTFKGIIGLTPDTNYLVSGNTVVILKSYLNSLESGTKVLTFDFGVASNPEITIETTIGSLFDVSIGTAEGKAGDTVTVPITFANAAAVGNIGTCALYIGYDTSLLEATAVTAGAIVTNAGINFDSKINAANGTISIVFLDNTIGDELIKTDGVFANIAFKLKSTATVVTSPVVFKPDVVFGDANFQKIISGVRKTNGSVNIKASIPAIFPTIATIARGYASDLAVSLTPNGNPFRGITGLVLGTDYTVSGNNVIILRNYLNRLPIGAKALTFDFGLESNPVLNLYFQYYDRHFEVKIGTAVAKVGDTVTVPITFTRAAQAGNIGVCNFYIDYDTSLLEATAVTAGAIVTNAGINFMSSISATNGTISFIFLDNTMGSELIKTDGVFANISFKVKSTPTDATTPVVFKKGGSFGDGNFSKITAVLITNGSVVLKAASIPTME